MPRGGQTRLMNEPDLEAEQIEQCMTLSRDGLTQRQIARIVGISQTTVHDRIKKGYLKVITPAVTEMRKIENDRLDAQQDIAQRIADDEKADPELRLKALDRLGRISARRAALNGLDSPVKVDVTTTEITAQERELQAIVAQAERDNKVQEAALRERRAVR